MSALPDSPRGDGAAVSGGFGRRSRDGLGPDLTRRWGTALLALLLLGTFASRLAFGLHTVLDGDEATTAFTALRITQGHLVLMEANQHYQGALESYLMAPFVWLLGPTVIAVIVPLALIAALYVVALWDLGRTVFGRRSAGLLLAGVGSVFPLFVLIWSTKALSGYAETMLLAVVSLSLAARIGWRPGGARLRNWTLLGLVTGVGLWNFALIAVPLLPIVVALLCRGPAIGWRRTWQGVAAAACGALVGFSPWIAYNVTHGLASLQNLPSAGTSVPHAVKGLVEQELPIFVGTSPQCGSATVTPWVAWAGLAALTAAVLWLRRRPLARLLRGDLTSVEAAEMVLAVAPVALAAVLVGRFNGVPCEPRYLLPLGIPLAFAATQVLLAARSQWRLLATGLCAAYLVMASFTTAGPTVNSGSTTTTLAPIPMDRNQIVAALEARHVTVLFADYWVARPILYLSGGSITAAVYNGPIAFPSVQAAAESSPDPPWLFVDGDPTIGTFEALMRNRRVTATEIGVAGYELFEDFSAPLRPGDLTATGG
ncbi:MAG: hypothetical protein ACLQT7_00850 [Candidatus Dormibacteria bacterium]